MGTPALPSGESDLSQLVSVAQEIGAALDSRQKRIIVNKSTVPIGSGNWVEMLVKQGIQTKQPVTVGAGNRSSQLSGDDLPEFVVVSNPEFLREGSAILIRFILIESWWAVTINLPLSQWKNYINH